MHGITTGSDTHARLLSDGMTMREFENILVPTDFLQHSIKALALALCFGRRFDSTVHVLLVYERPIRPATKDEILIPNDSWGTTNLNGAEHRLEGLVRQIEGAGLQGKYHLLEGHANEVILGLAQEIPANLIVMGTEGRTGFSRFVSGSIAERIVRLAPCPVLTVSDRVTGRLAER